MKLRSVKLKLGRTAAGLGCKGEKNSGKWPLCHETCIFLLKRSSIDLKFIHRLKLCIFARKYRFKLCIFTAVQLLQSTADLLCCFDAMVDNRRCSKANL